MEGNASDPNVGDFRVYQPLFNAVLHGDWDKARTFLDQYPEAVRAKAPRSGKNALHVAVTKGDLEIVKGLVERMTEQDLEMVRVDGSTALVVAVSYGYLSIAQCLVRKNIRLVSIVQHTYVLPVTHAVNCGQVRMATYLYSVTPLETLFLDQGKPGAYFLRQCILEKRFDLALDLMKHAPDFVITEDFEGYSPVGELSFQNVFASICSLRIWQKWILYCITVPDCALNHSFTDAQNLVDIQDDKKGKTIESSGFLLHCREAPSKLFRWMASNLLKLLDIERIRKMKLDLVQYRELLHRTCEVIKSTDEMRLEEVGMNNAIIRAARVGNVEFIKSIAEANPELLLDPSVASQVFEVALEVRQANIFSLIYGLPDKVALTSDPDENNSNMLHKAATVAPSRLLNLIPGAALQMQRELQWFKEVERIAAPRAGVWVTNQGGLKPREIFTESHKNLVIEGEKWMKDTSSSCTVVGALIVTITFAAAFTFPGGNDQNTGFPMFINRKLFKVFMLSNAIALFTSTTSVLMFLGILTSRYAEEDFLESLPKKLIIGLSTLFLSIAAMIVAFCAGISIMFHGELWIVMPSVCLASIPVALFALMQFPLLVDIFKFTYGPSIFDRNVQPWIYG